MTNYEAMKAGLIYNPSDEAIMKDQTACMEKLYDYNATRPSEMDKRTELLSGMLAECGEGCYVEPPFYANWAGAHVHFGDYVYANFGLTLVDDGDIFIGNHVMFGPHVTIATANHPIWPTPRDKGWQYNKTVRIGNNVWIGAGVTIVPGVTIGDNSVIGAGAVVTKNIPEGVIAVGNPCRVLRPITEHDQIYFYKNEKIDWDMIAELENE